MKMKWLKFILPGVLCLGAYAQDQELSYSFNHFADGPIDGQMEWDVYDKVPDSSALSIMDVLGASGVDGDKALVIRASQTPIRCVIGEPVRWLPGRTLSMEFDFRIAVEPRSLSMPKPVMTVMMGNSLLSEKARWELRLEASPSGDWVLVGALPDGSSSRIYGERFMIRSAKDLSISPWYRLKLTAFKSTELDSFKTHVEIVGAESGERVTELNFTDNNKDKIAQAMWNTARAHVGFYAAKDQIGLVCVDNLRVRAFDSE
ncbi:hypothetical protein [Pontiella sp.]|uniref:hypothetical protein n=1 Tax=Pontiella sp. TaxID=2837462 RepID=UPI003566FE83